MEECLRRINTLVTEGKKKAGLDANKPLDALVSSTIVKFYV